MMNKNDIAILRELSKEYAEIASLPTMDEKRQLWYKLNCGESTRPMVLIDQLPWNELETDNQLTCKVEDPFWREVERDLRRTLYKYRHFPVDMVVNPYVCLPRPINDSGFGIEADMQRLESEVGTTAASQHYMNLIKSQDDLEKIKMPVVTLDTAREAEVVEQAEMVFEGILPYKLTGISPHLGVWDEITTWMGIENIYMELYDRPQMMHDLMEKVTQGLISRIEQMNALGLFDIHTNICHCSHTYSDDLPGSGDDVYVTSDRAWAFGLAQLFTSVSPRITEEFEVEYMKRIYPYFGAIYYGCCDRLDDRMDRIAKLPKVRKLSCSPWSEREAFAERMPNGVVMSNKPTPALLAEDNFSEDRIRADIRRTIEAARAYDRPLELILKDISTVHHEPSRLTCWAKIAMEEVGYYSK